jgi:hypothetical protein
MPPPKLTSLLNGFSATTVLIFLVLATWFIRPVYDMVNAHDVAISRTADAVKSLDALAQDLKRRVDDLEKTKQP